MKHVEVESVLSKLRERGGYVDSFVVKGLSLENARLLQAEYQDRCGEPCRLGSTWTVKVSGMR